jgi:hypothetical protein
VFELWRLEQKAKVMPSEASIGKSSKETRLGQVAADSLLFSFLSFSH